MAINASLGGKLHHFFLKASVQTDKLDFFFLPLSVSEPPCEAMHSVKVFWDHNNKHAKSKLACALVAEAKKYDFYKMI